MIPFPAPWHLVETGPEEWVVLDADDRKLFYIKCDEGQDTDDPDSADYIAPSALGVRHR